MNVLGKIRRWLVVLLAVPVLVGLVGVAARSAHGAVVDLATAGGSPKDVRDWSLDRLVGDLASALLLVAATGLAVMSGLAITAALAAQRAPTVAAICSRVTPHRCRRLAVVVLGLGLTAPVLADGPALASDQGHVVGCRVAHLPAPGHASLQGLGFPDLPSAPTPHSRPGPGFQHIVVREGDSLWRIAEQRLPRAAPTGEVSALTWALYVMNRSTIGDDPDLIYPGMTLIAPEGSS